MGTDETGEWVSQVYRSYGAELKRFLTRRLGDAVAAEDLVQETFLQLHQLEQAQVRHPAALLFVVASRLARRYRKRMPPQGADDPEEAEAVPDPAPIPEMVVEVEDAMRALQVIVGAMPRRLSEVWIPRYVDGLSRAQIAQRLGLRLTTVRRRLDRAMLYCREQLSKGGIGRVGRS